MLSSSASNVDSVEKQGALSLTAAHRKRRIHAACLPELLIVNCRVRDVQGLPVDRIAAEIGTLAIEKLLITKNTKTHDAQPRTRFVSNCQCRARWSIACCAVAEHELQHRDETLTVQLNLEWPLGQSSVHGHGRRTGSSQTMMLLGPGVEQRQRRPGRAGDE
jgi:hypothetical protein